MFIDIHMDFLQYTHIYNCNMNNNIHKISENSYYLYIENS